MINNYIFISDVHLGLQAKSIEIEKERKLVRLLNFAADNCREIFIVGDLFDYWFEYRRVYQKGYFRTLTALQDLTEAGIKVNYLIGNHDFMHRNFFEDEIGAKLFHDGIERELNGKKFFIAHGDGLVKNDTGYNILKKIMRNKTLQNLYSFLHPDLGVFLASSTSKSSRDYTTQKDYGALDGLFDAAKVKIDDGFDYVLFGHLHQRMCKNYKTGTYVNLGSWLDKPCYGFFNEKFEIVNWN